MCPWGHFRSLWGHFGVTLSDFKVTLGVTFGHFRVHFRVTLRSLWVIEKSSKRGSKMSNFKVPKSLVFLRKNKEFWKSASRLSVTAGHPYPPSDSLPVINIDQGNVHRQQALPVIRQPPPRSDRSSKKNVFLLIYILFWLIFRKSASLPSGRIASHPFPQTPFPRYN